jgi:hypothetical protein
MFSLWRHIMEHLEYGMEVTWDFCIIEHRSHSKSCTHVYVYRFYYEIIQNTKIRGYCTIHHSQTILISRKTVLEV